MRRMFPLLMVLVVFLVMVALAPAFATPTNPTEQGKIENVPNLEVTVPIPVPDLIRHLNGCACPNCMKITNYDNTGLGVNYDGPDCGLRHESGYDRTIRSAAHPLSVRQT